MVCGHRSTRRIVIVGTDVDWIVCNRCDSLVGVVGRGKDTRRFPYRSVADDIERISQAKAKRLLGKLAPLGEK